MNEKTKGMNADDEAKRHKRQKARLGIMIISASSIVILIYLWSLPWWFAPLFLLPGPVILFCAIVYEKITKKKNIIEELSRNEGHKK